MSSLCSWIGQLPDNRYPFPFGRTHYQYSPLPPGHIRVIELQPGTKADPLVCRLLAVKTADNLVYEAVSYVWGNPQRRVNLNCEDKVIRITTSLAQVLRRVRYADRSRVVWADAVSINQEDLEERKEQVRKMGFIYTKARRVLAWLGPDPGDASLAVNLMTRFNTLLDDYDSWLDVPDLSERQISQWTQGYEAQWRAVGRLCDSPLFRRVWIIQELGLATRCSFLLGEYEIDQILLSNFSTLLGAKAFKIIHDYSIRLPKIAFFRGLFFSGQETQESYERNGQHGFAKTEGFLHTLDAARGHGASDPRDMVYSLLGHPSAVVGDSLIIEPDYTKSTNEVFIEISTRLIRLSASLDVLSAVGHSDEINTASLPSWVPSWSSKFSDVSLCLHVDVGYHADRDCGEVRFNFTRQGILEVRGLVLDAIQSHTGIIKDEHLSVGLQRQPARVVRKLGEPWNDLFDGTKPSESSVRAGSFILALTAGERHGKSVEDNMNQYRADFAAYCQMLDPDFVKVITILTNTESPHPWGVSHDSAGNISPGDPLDFEFCVKGHCVDRRLFRTLGGYFGNGPKAIRKGDLCCVLFGSRIPMILRPEGWHYLLVGETYLHGYMHGEAIEKWRRGEVNDQAFELH